MSRERYGAEVPRLRPETLATATSPDIDWVLEAMKGRKEDVFAIVRPTSPFRTGATIRRAHERLLELGDRADSIRAVRARDGLSRPCGRGWSDERLGSVLLSALHRLEDPVDVR